MLAYEGTTARAALLGGALHLHHLDAPSLAGFPAAPLGLILVTGGRAPSREVVASLQAAGRRVRVLSRYPHTTGASVEYAVGDLRTGEGVRDAVGGGGTIIRCAGTGSGDELLTRHLVDAAHAMGPRTWSSSRWWARIGSRATAASTA